MRSFESIEDKEALVKWILANLKPREAVEKRTRWFLEMMIDQAGFDVVEVASRVFAPDFVATSRHKRNRPGPRSKAHSVARQVAKRWEAYQRAHGGLSVEALYEEFLKILPPHLRPRANRRSVELGQSSKTISNVISLGTRLNRQRPLLVRIAAARKSAPRGLADIDGKRTIRIAEETRALAEQASDEEFLKRRLSEAEYESACARSALLGLEPGLASLFRK
jgi:hypothetical protein